MERKFSGKFSDRRQRNKELVTITNEEVARKG